MIRVNHWIRKLSRILVRLQYNLRRLAASRYLFVILWKERVLQSLQEGPPFRSNTLYRCRRRAQTQSVPFMFTHLTVTVVKAAMFMLDLPPKPLQVNQPRDQCLQTGFETLLPISACSICAPSPKTTHAPARPRRPHNGAFGLPIPLMAPI